MRFRDFKKLTESSILNELDPMVDLEKVRRMPGGFDFGLGSRSATAEPKLKMPKQQQPTTAPAAAGKFNVEVPSGNTGIEVADAQKALMALGFALPKHGVDGIIGPETTGAITAFQKANKLPATGALDNATVKKLNDLLAARPDIASKLKKSTQADVKRSSGQGLRAGAGQPGIALKEPEFMPKLEKVANNLGVSTDNLLKIMRFESKLNPQAVNRYSGATGLIQFMPKTAAGLGTSTDELFNMSATKQLDYVEMYYKQNGVKPGSTVGDLYLLTFMPAARNKSDNFVLGTLEGGSVFGLDARLVYQQNKAFDTENKGYFTVGDVKRKVEQQA